MFDHHTDQKPADPRLIDEAAAVPRHLLFRRDQHRLDFRDTQPVILNLLANRGLDNIQRRPRINPSSSIMPSAAGDKRAHGLSFEALARIAAGRFI